MYNVPDDVTMLQLNMSFWVTTEEEKSYERTTTLPRLLWVRLDMSLKDLHKEVFKSMRYTFSEWAYWSDKDCTREL